LKLKSKNKTQIYQHIKDWFDSDAPNILRGRNNNEALQDYANYILKYCNIKSGSRVLEIGCGDAMVMKRMKSIRPDIEFFGIDISSSQIDKAKSNLKDAKFKISNAVESIYFDQKFDVIFSFSTIQYIQRSDLKAFNSNCIQVLSDKGKICHMSIPDINKKKKYLFEGLRTKYNSFFAYFLMLIKDKLDNNYGKDGGVWHNPEMLYTTMDPLFDIKISSPSDSWYRFDFNLELKK